MKFFTTIYFWLVGGSIFLFILFYIVIVGAFIDRKKLQAHVRKMLRFWFKAMFIKVEVIYEQEIDWSKSYILMPNHVSFIDVYLSGAFIPVPLNALEAHTHFKWFLYGKAIKRMGQIPIDRTRPKSSWNSYLTAIERLKQGYSIVVYPEGHRSGDGILQEFKKIPFKFAKEANADIIPIAYIGVEKMRKHLIWVKPSPVRVVFGKVIPAQKAQELTVEQLRDLVRNEIERMLKQYAFDK